MGFKKTENRILHVNAHVDGGAGTAAWRLHKGLLNEGVTSEFYSVGGLFRGYEKSNPLRVKGKKAAWLSHILMLEFLRVRYSQWRVHGLRRDLSFEFSYMRNAARLSVEKSLESLVDDRTIVNLHWLGGFFDWPELLASLQRAAGIVWTLHDMHAFTGGCHYAGSCMNYETYCRKCPHLRAWPIDYCRDAFELRRRLYRNRPFHVVADSKWLEQKAHSSALLQNCKSIRTIYYGLDTGSFYPEDKCQSRSFLGIDCNSFIIGFGAWAIDSPRKGIRTLLRGLDLLRDRLKYNLLVFGAGDAGCYPKGCNFFGEVQSLHDLRRIYNAADVFVMPSVEEAFGQTALEAMACGTPVVASRSGGIPEFIEDGVTGLLADPGDAGQFAEHIQWMADHKSDRLEMGRRASAVVADEFVLKVQADKYLSLYSEILENKGTSESAHRV